MILWIDFLWLNFLWNFRNFILFFMCLVYMDLFGYTKSYILIDSYISVDLHFPVIGNVYHVRILCVTVTNKYTLPSRRVQICPIFLGDVKKYKAVKYSKMPDFWLLS
jgi:hypothetical protein